MKRKVYIFPLVEIVEVNTSKIMFTEELSTGAANPAPARRFGEGKAEVF